MTSAAQGGWRKKGKNKKKETEWPSYASTAALLQRQIWVNDGDIIVRGRGGAGGGGGHTHVILLLFFFFYHVLKTCTPQNDPGRARSGMVGKSNNGPRAPMDVSWNRELM